jgi:hypothetical protein
MLRSLDDLRVRLADGDFTFSRHAFVRSVERNISDDEIREAGRQAVLIENYPTDKYSPSCLLLGWSDAGRPLHLQVSRAETTMVHIITLYEPDEKEWGAGYTKWR